MRSLLRSCTLYVDATPTSVAAYFVGSPTCTFQHLYTDQKAIAWAEMAVALAGLVWTQRDILTQPTTITLCTDSSSVLYTVSKGTGAMLRQSPILQELYYKMYLLKIKSGHILVVRWVLSAENPTDPPSPEVCTPDNIGLASL
jgi:hypothetical protein